MFLRILYKVIVMMEWVYSGKYYGSGFRNYVGSRSFKEC